ncbi:hypothetical protein NC653_001036 [Populus alba x Populus x berolinensis]|uniref:Malic enzyme N-terminal domain-containing protein n=1 Tax=Populus alba x Populus x berolinensis TaxID=444605 RepID=A0AAD6RL41_9ROSI|nr:hypothetical protein NC653_001036 [Populus alba x Populus x berolinensis]
MKATFQLESLGEISCILAEIMGWGNILKASKNWLERNIQSLLLLMCLPVAIAFGTNNEKLLNDEFYIRLGQKRVTL